MKTYITSTFMVISIDKGNETTGLAGGCTSRILETLVNWPGLLQGLTFDDMKTMNNEAGFGVPPLGCDNPNMDVSTAVDPNGVNLTCQANINWGAYGQRARFTWRGKSLVGQHSTMPLHTDKRGWQQCSHLVCQQSHRVRHACCVGSSSLLNPFSSMNFTSK